MSSSITLEASDGHKFEAFQAGAPNAERAVIVLQEIFGVTPYIRKLCEQFAELGYQAVAPALFDRVERGVTFNYDAEGLDAGLDVMQRIKPSDSFQDVEAVADYLHEAGHKRVGIIGFCWGGTIAWQMATHSTKVQAAVAWYGGGIATESHVKPLCPVQLHFGGLDPYIPHVDILKIRQNQPDLELFVYDDADHGFGCFERDSFNKEAAELAWQRSADFLDQFV